MKFKKIVAVVCLLFAVCLGFYGCGEVFKTGPNVNDAVIGNGGLAVMKGEYIYFVNGYKSASDNYNSNKGDDIYYSSIYRVKANNVSYNVFKDESGNTQLNFNEGTLAECDENGNLPGAERLVSKVAGFENTKLFIFDNTLYFTTHTNSKSLSSGESNTSGVEVYRVDLNGKNFKKVYSMSSFSDNGEVNFYKNGGDVYGVFFDGTNKLAIYKNNKKFVEELGVTDVAMPYFNYYSNQIDNSAKQVVFYLQDSKLKILVVGSKTENSFDSDSTPSKLIGVSNNKLLFVQRDINTNSDYVKFVNTQFESLDNEAKVLSYQTCTEYAVMNTETVQIAVKTSNGIEIYKYRENEIPEAVTLSTNADAKLLLVSGENVFYRTDEAIFLRNEHMVNNNIDEINLTEKVDKKPVFNGNSVASVTDKFVYFYTQFDLGDDKKSNPYLARIDISKAQMDIFASNDVCVRLSEDYKPKEESSENK